MCIRLRFRLRGFTLIELLVVIVVLTIIAGILFPVFDEAREKSKRSACLSNLRQIATAVLAYSQDYDERYPQEYLTCPNPARGVAPAGDYNGSLENTDYGSPLQKIVPFLAGHSGLSSSRSQELFVCPDDPDPHGLTLAKSTPSSSVHAVTSYVVNAYFLFGLSAALVSQPAETIYIAERNPKFCDDAVRPWLGETIDARGSVGKVGGDIPYPQCISNNSSIDREFAIASERHLLGANYSFADGHVRWELYLDTIAPAGPDQNCFGQYQALAEEPGSRK